MPKPLTLLPHPSQMKRIPTLVLLAVSALGAIAQQKQGLPHIMAPSEVPLIRDYKESRAGTSRGITTPPDFTPRTMAEWEEVQSVVIAWTSYPGVLKQIVRVAKEEC